MKIKNQKSKIKNQKFKIKNQNSKIKIIELILNWLKQESCGNQAKLSHSR